jgi:aryl-alcohol dehydrogenase-like predicted oxidoreductase
VPELINVVKTEALLADKVYDSDKIVQSAQTQGRKAIVSSKVNRKIQRPVDKERYKARHLVENLFQRMTNRLDRLDTSYWDFAYIASVMKWFTKLSEHSLVTFS